MQSFYKIISFYNVDTNIGTATTVNIYLFYYNSFFSSFIENNLKYVTFKFIFIYIKGCHICGTLIVIDLFLEEQFKCSILCKHQPQKYTEWTVDKYMFLIQVIAN